MIYILGAIFLLGALTIMVRGSSTPGGGIDEERLIIRISEVQAYGRELEEAISYIFQNAHSEADIRFAHPDADVTYGDITDTPSRQVFSRDGGGATYRPPASDIQTTPTNWVFSGNNSVPQIGSDKNDLVAFLPNVSQAFCMLLNDKNEIDNPSDAPPQDTNSFDITSLFTGAFGGTDIVGTIAINGTKMEGCLEGNGTPPSGAYYYYRVLMPR